jgi:CubicO group peptidase (beta-lactamase class C family)
VTPEISGTCDPAFEPVRDAFATLFDRRPGGGPPDVGSAVALMVEGRLVVDLWAGFADCARTTPWAQDTIATVMSASKGIAALCAAMLVDRGQLDYDEQVATYWPEFAKNGKEATTVRHVLAHQAGLANVGGLDNKLFEDWGGVIRALEDAAPDWEPGTAHGYHTLTFGHLVGEIIRRVDGRDIGTFIRDELNQPLGVELLMGVRPGEERRCAERCMVLAPEQTADDPMAVALADFIEALNRPSWRAAQIPAAGMHTDARSLARVYGALAIGGSLDGVTLLSTDTLDAATTTQVKGLDLTRMFAIPDCVSEYGLGWFLAGDAEAPLKSPGNFGHGGMFGSWGWASREHGLGFGYVLNDCWPNEHFGSADTRGAFLLDAATSVI